MDELKGIDADTTYSWLDAYSTTKWVKHTDTIVNNMCEFQQQDS